jgi:hypothetical protein
LSSFYLFVSSRFLQLYSNMYSHVFQGEI